MRSILIALAAVMAMATPSSAEEIEFDQFCVGIEPALLYAYALDGQNADALNTLIEGEKCGFFTLLFGGTKARGEITDTTTVPGTNFVVHSIRFSNGIRVATVSSESY